MKPIVVTAFLAFALPASAGEFFLRYDGEKSYPEQDGWTRLLYDPEGGLVRTLEDGALVLDTRASLLTSDRYRTDDAALAPLAGELLRVTWRVQTTFSNGGLGLSEVALILVASDLRYVELQIGPDFVADDRYLGDEPSLIKPIAPGDFHTFELLTADLERYELYVDGVSAFGADLHGEALGFGPRMVFGDLLIGGVTSVAAWDFVEVAVTPDASTLSLFVAAIALSAMRRNVTCLR